MQKLLTQRYCAVHKLSSGDQRLLEYTKTNGTVTALHRDYLASDTTVRTASDAVVHNYIHTLDHHYQYGTSYKPNSESEIYTQMHTTGLNDYVIVRKSQLPNDYTGWSAVATDEIVQHMNTNDQTLVSGLHGVADVLGIPDTAAFLWVSIERFQSVVAIICGSHIVRHYTVSVGTSSIIQSLIEHLHCDAGFARGVIEKHGLMYSHHDSDVRDLIVDCLSPVVSLLKQVIDFSANAPYKNTIERQPLQSWVLAGVAALSIPGLAEYIQSQIILPQYTGISDHWAGLIQSSNTNITQVTLPRYYILLGICASA
jgi:hypothetical protein